MSEKYSWIPLNPRPQGYCFFIWLFVFSITLSNNVRAYDCIDTSGDGWGWDGQQSCKLPETASVCVDTVPLGDGWGWDGRQSCTLPEITTVCVDTVPVGDGWGWDGRQSCEVPQAASVCVDTVPLGDGWGWDGGQSCSLPGGLVPDVRPELQTIMATGDSITHGTLGQRSYRYYLVSKFRNAECNFEMVGNQKDNQTVTSFQSPHEGYSHHRANHFLTGYASPTGHNVGISQAMMQFDPDVILLHIGSNDIYGGEGVSETVSEIREIVEEMLALNPQAKVFLANVIPWFGGSSLNPNVTTEIQALGVELRSLVGVLNSSNLRLVDVNVGYTREMMLPDLVHPNDIGEAHIANAFYEALILEGICVAG